MRKVRRLFLLVCVLSISVNVFAPHFSNEMREQMLWNHMVAQNKLRVQEMRTKELNRYLEAIGHSESRGNPKAYNSYGYIGKYQFGYTARKSCGYGQVKFKDFIKDASVWSEKDQEAAMITLLSKNESHLKNVIQKYNGKTIKGVTVTKSGILAAAHLAGAGGVKKYFRNGSNPRDAYGTGLEDYLLKFSGFNI